jgi:hypothetical protein
MLKIATFYPPITWEIFWGMIFLWFWQKIRNLHQKWRWKNVLSFSIGCLLQKINILILRCHKFFQSSYKKFLGCLHPYVCPVCPSVCPSVIARYLSLESRFCKCIYLAAFKWSQLLKYKSDQKNKNTKRFVRTRSSFWNIILIYMLHSFKTRKLKKAEMSTFDSNMLSSVKDFSKFFNF